MCIARIRVHVLNASRNAMENDFTLEKNMLQLWREDRNHQISPSKAALKIVMSFFRDNFKIFLQILEM